MEGPKERRYFLSSRKAIGSRCKGAGFFATRRGGKARLVDFFLRVRDVDFGKKIVGSSPTMTGGGPFLGLRAILFARAFLVLRPIIVGGSSFGLAVSLGARVLGLANALGRGRPHQCRSVGGDDCGAVPGNGDGGASSERRAWKKFAQSGDPSGRPVLGLKRLPGQARQYAATRRFVKEIIHMSALADCQ